MSENVEPDRVLLKGEDGKEITLTIDWSKQNLCVICNQPGSGDDKGIKLVDNESGKTVLEGYAHQACIDSLTVNLSQR